eukprot:TRINITY_DN3556_c0_g2_i1.p1 TRINITY_DN3556_c0_g2~~TRINITY_DN3556_c0_g2_i1.p1  ORF type:complete len:448 (-),score=113.39 TRINITY_DN3556_c0_g2_i1:84-1427(-)
MAAAVAHAVKKRNEHREQLAAAAAGEQPDEQKEKKKKKREAKAPAVLLPPEVQTGFWKYQRPAAILYLNIKVQMGVAGLIVGNFGINIIEKWVDPRAIHAKGVWDGFNIFFNVAFAIELALNMYSFWCKAFWKSGWNVFDFVVVTIGLINMTPIPMPGPLKLLRMMRAFRVFRLFKRVKSLNKIITSLARALPSHMNAFCILTLVMAIYAMLGVEFFLEYANDGFLENESGNRFEYVTARNLPYGYEYWGNFGKSMYTMFQVLTTESWSEVVGRPLLHTTNDILTFGASFFFVSFQIICGIVLVNVVIAILLEKMVDNGDEAAPDDDSDEEDEDEAEDISEMELEVQQLKKDMADVKAQLQVLFEAVQTRATHSLAPDGLPSVEEKAENVEMTSRREDEKIEESPQAENPQEEEQTQDNPQEDKMYDELLEEESRNQHASASKTTVS